MKVDIFQSVKSPPPPGTHHIQDTPNEILLRQNKTRQEPTKKSIYVLILAELYSIKRALDCPEVFFTFAGAIIAVADDVII